MTGQTGPERHPAGVAFVIAAGLAILAVVMLWDASRLSQDGGYGGVGPADVPRLVAFGLLALSVATVVAGLRGQVQRAPRQQPVPVLWILGGLGLQLMLLHAAGFIVAGAMLFGFTARGLGRRPLWLTCAVGLVIATLIYGMFDGILKLDLPGGPLERLIFGG